MEWKGLEKLEERVFLDGAYVNEIPYGGKFSYTGDAGAVEVKLGRGVQGSWELDSGKDLFMEIRGGERVSLMIKGAADIERLDAVNGLRSLNARDSDVEDGGIVNILGEVKSVSLDDVFDGARVNLGSVGSFKVDQFNGDYEAGRTRKFLANNVNGADIFSGKLDSFYSKTGVSNSEIERDAGFKEGKFLSGGNVSNSEIGAFYQYSVLGNLNGSEIGLGQYTKYFSVRGNVEDSVIQSSLNSATLERVNVFGNFMESSIFVLWNPGADGVYSTGDDGGFLAGRSFRELFVNVRGKLSDSFIVTKNVNMVRLGSVSDFGEGGRDYGVFCSNAEHLISKGKVRIGKSKYSRPIGDFIVREPEIGTRPTPMPPPF